MPYLLILAAIAGSEDCLQYDDGVASGIGWGPWRGVWFHTADFYPEPYDFRLGAAEFWFYHHSAYPWDTDQFYAQVWNGGQAGPSVQLWETVAQAQHMAPVMVFPGDSVEVESDFWVCVSTELSAGGWPSSPMDGAGCGHSGPDQGGDWLIRAHGSPLGSSLACETWGGIKALYR